MIDLTLKICEPDVPSLGDLHSRLLRINDLNSSTLSHLRNLHTNLWGVKENPEPTKESHVAIEGVIHGLMQIAAKNIDTAEKLEYIVGNICHTIIADENSLE